MKPFQLNDKETGEKRAGGAWFIKFRAPDGSSRRQIGGRTEAEANNALAAIKTDIARGVWVDPRVTTPDEDLARKFKTFGDVCKAFEEYYSKRAESTRRNLKRSLAELFGGLKGRAPLLSSETPIAEITRARVRRARDLIDTLPLSVATKNLELHYLRAILKWAHEHPSIPISSNLASDLERFRARGTRGGDGMLRPVSRDEVFSLADAMKMLEYASTASAHVLAVMLRTAFLTGMRRGELCGVKWCDVDFDQRSILVCRNFDRRGTKSGRDRSVPMKPELVTALREWKARSPFSKTHSPVFPTEDGKHRGERFNWSHYVNRVAIGAGVAREEMGRWGHATRHFYATQWLLAGGSDSVLAKILGHKDTSLIHAVYSHFCDRDLVEAIDRLAFSLEPTAEPISEIPVVVSSEVG